MINGKQLSFKILSTVYFLNLLEITWLIKDTPVKTVVRPVGSEMFKIVFWVIIKSWEFPGVFHIEDMGETFFYWYSIFLMVGEHDFSNGAICS